MHQQVVALVRAYTSFRRRRQAGREARKQLQEQAGRSPSQEEMDLDAEDDEDEDLSKGTALGLRENLQLLPLYCLAMQKCPLFRGGTDVPPDYRASLVYRSLCMPTVMATTFFYPRMFALHTMPKESGTPLSSEEAARIEQEDGEEPNVAGFSNVQLPPPVSLSSSQLDPKGVYLLEDSTDMFVWFGKDCPPATMRQFLGIDSLKGIDTGSAPFPVIDTDVSRRTHGIIAALVETYAQEPTIRVVYQTAGDELERRFAWRLVEDQQQFRGGSMAYTSYVDVVQKEAAGSPKQIGMGAGAGGPPAALGGPPPSGAPGAPHSMAMQ